MFEDVLLLNDVALRSFEIEIAVTNVDYHDGQRVKTITFPTPFPAFLFSASSYSSLFFPPTNRLVKQLRSVAKRSTSLAYRSVFD